MYPLVISSRSISRKSKGLTWALSLYSHIMANEEFDIVPGGTPYSGLYRGTLSVWFVSLCTSTCTQEQNPEMCAWGIRQ